MRLLNMLVELVARAQAAVYNTSIEMRGQREYDTWVECELALHIEALFIRSRALELVYENMQRAVL